VIAAKKKPIQDPGESYDDVPLDKIVDSPLNPRRTFGDLTELKESIRKGGLIHAPLVRPAPSMPHGTYEIVCGHRRVRACRELGVHAIACVIRDLEDLTVIELQLIENSTREDVPPIEEAEAYARLHAPKDNGGFGLSLEELADKVSKSVSHVQRRLRLAGLAPVVKQAVAEGFLTAPAAVALSRLESHADQAEIVGDVLKKAKGQPGDAGFKPASENDVHWLIEQQMRTLTEAPFDTKNAKLVPAAGACTTCPKRTLAQRTLFPVEEHRANEDDDQCTDGDCWRAKVHAHGLVELGKTKAKVLPPEEARAYLSDYGGIDTKKVVDIDKRVDPYGNSNKKWKDVVKDKIEAVVVIDGDGVPHHVVPMKDAKALLPKEVKVKGGDLTSAPLPSQRDPLEDEVDAAVLEAVKDAAVDRAKKKQDLELWRAFAVIIAKNEYESGIESKAKKAKTVADVAAVFVELLVLRSYGAEAKALFEDLLGKAEAKAIAKKAEDEVRAKYTGPAGDKAREATKKVAKKKAKR
jgi:ParB/RepB/Spo0J family partition protein